MSVKDAIIRGYNFFVVAFLGIAGGAVVSLFFEETYFPYRIDEILLVLVAIAAIAWYLVGRNRFHLSVIPIVLAVLGLGAKILGLVIEANSPADAGDDYGILASLILLVIVAVVAYFRTRALVKASGE